jgi:hypothetical protein
MELLSAVFAEKVSFSRAPQLSTEPDWLQHLMCRRLHSTHAEGLQYRST